MSDLISKKEFNDKLIKIMLKCSNWSAEEAIGEALGELSESKVVDAVEVVRCKDCRYATMTADGRFAKTCAMWPNEYYFDADYFCAEGERKEVDK